MPNLMDHNVSEENTQEEEISEFTWMALILGALLAIILGAANMYIGLYAGMTVSASIPAAVISMGILRGVFRKGTILENNLVQTVASTGESLAAGIVFTVPALIIAGVWTDFDYWTVTLIAFTGGMLGILFMIPMRKTLIIEETTLAFPEGTACAEVLKSGEGTRVGLREILVGMILGGATKFVISGIALCKGTVEVAKRVGNSLFYAGSDVSAALVGVGAIVGFNVSVLMFIGGALGWLVAIPILSLNHSASGVALDAVWDLWSRKVRYMGVGAMIVAGVWSLVTIRHGIVNGFKEVFLSRQSGKKSPQARTERNIPTRNILIMVAVITVITALFCWFYVRSLSITVAATALVIILSFFLTAVASYICGLVGSSNSPVSGMTICALLLTALLFWLLGLKGGVAIIATLTVSGIICCATCTSGDISQDLKTGYLVKATPAKQQWGEIIGTVVTVFIFAPVLALLHHSYGIGTNAPGSLEAPQAALFAGLTKAIFGDEKMPWDMLIIGIIGAIVIVIIDEMLAIKGKGFRLYPMPLAVGIYLPFSLSIPILLGGLIELVIKVSTRKKGGNRDNAMRPVILLSSGLIAGEALMGILVAIAIALVAYYEWKTKIPIALDIREAVRTTLSLLLLVGISGYLLLKGKQAQ